MKTKNLDNLERSRICDLLLEKSSGGKPKHGSMSEIAAQFGVCRKTVTDIWNQAKKQHSAGDGINANSKLKGRRMPSRLTFDTTKLENVEMGKRTTRHEVSEGMGVSQATVSRWVKAKLIDSHTNAVKPLLTYKNKLDRLIYCLSQLQYNKLTKQFVFKEQTRPKYGPNKEVICDGKLGIWSFVMEVPAKRKSKNRSVGTLETKCIHSITKQVTKDMLITNVLPTIKAKWAANYIKNILIQQDNARPHITNKDADFRKHGQADGWNIQFSYQPPNSPDLNACMLEIMKLKGGIDYPVSHMHKSKLAAQGILHEYLTADAEVVKECIKYVQNLGYASSISELLESISSVENISELTEHAGSSNGPTGENEPVGNITKEGVISTAVQVEDLQQHMDIDMRA
ncbi:uncharacterized protein LOC141607464 [Silene latifolia]|uniref:uncharacterized protein LOC141607464 n=1 Tax=Silene latifolia TaxID=37657 RepID=UPI003D78B059